VAEEPEGPRPKKKAKPVSSHYQIEGGRVRRILPFCERCGRGFFMADHGDRFTCGHCGFTRYKPQRKADEGHAG